MDVTTGAAIQHIRRMEERIAQQNAVIVELVRAGEDTIEASNRLGLLRRALEEMRLQLLGLLPTEAQDRLRAAR
jgi:hypothetical protein